MQWQYRSLVESETLTAIGEMAAAVAHGLRNPLFSVRASAELSLEDDPPSVVRESLNDIIKEVDRVEMWTRNLLTYSRADYDMSERVQVNDVLSACINAFAERTEHTGVNVVQEL